MKNFLLFLISVILLGFTDHSNAQVNTQVLQKNKQKKELLQRSPELQQKSGGAKANATWIGSVSTSWHTAANWDIGTVPTSSDYVLIPAGTPNSPVITSSAYCQGIYLYTGASLDQNTGSYFYCYGTFDAGFGQFTMTGSSYLYFRGSGDNLWWDDNQNDTYTYVRVEKVPSTASMTMQNDMTCSGTFEIREGVFTMENDRTLSITNAGSYAFEVENGGKLELLYNNKTIQITGGIVFRDGSQVDLQDAEISIGGNFHVESNVLYDIDFNWSKLKMNGSGTQYIQDLDGGNLYLGYLLIDKPSGSCYIANADLQIRGSMYINSGELSCLSSAGSATTYDIYIEGYWSNLVGDAGFDEATGRVIFMGDGISYISSETFHELEINKPAAGIFIGPYKDVTCSAYDWTSGYIAVFDESSFTANDLLDNAVQGDFRVHTGGTINLTNSGTGTYVDLKGDLHISGGTMNVTGSYSYWPYQQDASIEMSDGVLDFNCNGILIDDNAFALTDNITGGTIRTSGYFQGNRADFTPTAGTFELYGSSDFNISQSNGCTLHRVNINKSSKGDSFSPKQGQIVIDERSGEMIGNGSKSNTITLNSDFMVTGNLILQSGSLTLGGHELSVAHDCYVHGTINMTNPADVLRVIDNFLFLPGSTGNISEGVIYLNLFLGTQAGCSFTASTNNTIYFDGSATYCGLYNQEPSTVYGNIEVNTSANGIDLHFISTEPFIVDGDFIVHAGNTLEMNNETLIVHGNFVDDATSEIYAYNAKKDGGNGISSENEKPMDGGKSKGGSLEIDTDFTLNGLMDVGDGNILLHGSFDIATTGSLVINGGSVICDMPYTPGSSWQHIYGNFELSDGLFEISENSLMFGSTTTTNVSGGIIRVGTAFTSGTSPGVFVPSGGTVEMIGAGNVYCYPGNSFYNLMINHTYATGYTNYMTDIQVQNDIEIQLGGISCDIGFPDLYVGGNWTNNSGYFEPGEGTVHFTGGAEADILTNETFYNLSVDKTGASFDALEITAGNTVNVLNNLDIVDGSFELNLNNTLNIDGNLTIADNAGLNVNDVSANIMINIGGDWINNNTLAPTTVTGFDAGSYSTVTFNGSVNQHIDASYDPETFANLIINNSGTSPLDEFKPKDPLWITGGLTVNNGEWQDFTFGQTHHFEGDIMIDVLSGYGFNGGNMNTTSVLIGTADQNIYSDNNPAQDPNFGPVIINKVSTKGSGKVNDEGKTVYNNPQNPKSKSLTVTIHSDVRSANDELTIEEGTLYLNGINFSGVGDVNINTGGILNLNANAQLLLYNASELNINTGGLLEVIGSPGSPATITRSSSGYYDFNINAGGTISAEDAIFEYMGTNGVFVKDVAAIDVSHSFDNCTFRYGDNGGFSALLVINNNQTLTIDGANFPVDPGGTTSYNVAKALDQGNVTFTNANGFFAGPTFEYDTYDRINWSGFVPGLWTGAVSSDWFTPENWSDYIVPGATVNVSIPAGTPYSPVINTGGYAYCKSLFLYTGAALAQNTGSYFYCYGTFDAGFGQFTRNGTSYLYFRGSNDNLWYDDNQNDTYTYVRVEKTSSTASMTMQHDMACSGTFEIREGVFAMTEEDTLTVSNNGTYAFQVEDGGTLFLDGNKHVDVTGGIVFYDGSQLDITAGFVETGGNFRVESNTLYDIVFNAGWLEITGPGTQYIQDLDGGNLRLYSLKIDKPSGTCYISNEDLYLEMNMNIWSGTLSCRSSAGSPTTYDIYLTGSWNSVVGDTGFDEATGTVHFAGTQQADILNNETFYIVNVEKNVAGFEDLEIPTGITVNVLNNLNVVDGTLELNSNSTLNVGNDVNILFDAGLNAGGLDTDIDIFVGGDWLNFNTDYNTLYGYTPGGETITFNGTTDQIITTLAPKEDFGNLVIDKSTGQFRPNNNIDVMGNLLISDGEWNDNVSSLTHYFEGNFEVGIDGAFFSHLNHNTVEFKTTSDQSITYNSSSGYFRDIVINKTDWTAKKAVEGGGPSTIESSISNQNKNPKASSVTLNTNIYMQGGSGLTIDEGTLNLNGFQLFASGNIEINDGGSLNIDAGANIRMEDGDQINVNNGGYLTAIGTSGNNAKVTRKNTGYYDLNVNSGGTLSAEYAVFEYMDWLGVNITSGGIVDPAHAFNYCTFQNVNATNGASSISLGNAQVLNCTGAHFPDNPYYNIYKTTSSVGEITFNAATGDFAGPEFEYDLSGNVHWSAMDIELDLKVMLEGPYNGTGMNTDLNNQGLIPTDQPFWIDGSADWYYAGTESVSSIPPNVVDWVLVKIIDAAVAATSAGAPVVAEQAAFLLNDGSVVDLDGSTNLIFPGITYSSGLFPVVWQRNHLGIISSFKMPRQSDVYTWDFTQTGSAYSNTNPGVKDLGSGVFGMYSGDATGNGEISHYDNAYWSTLAGNKNYYQCDFNLNSQVDNIDKNDFWFWNLGKESQIPGSKNEGN